MLSRTQRLCFAYSVLAVLLFSVVSLHARETVSPVRGPASYALFGSLAELRDDVYSVDLNLAGDTLRQIIESPESFPSNRLNNNKIKKYLKNQVLNDDTGEIIDSDKLKALVDIDKVNEDLSLLGWYSIITSETYMDEKEIIDTYHNLVEIEDQFRVMKSTLDTRPLFVRTDEHIIAHLTMCTISLILLRLIQRKITTKFNKTLSADRIQRALNKWKVERLADDYYRFNDIDDQDLKMILQSFEIELAKKIYKPIDFRTLKSNIKLS